MALSGRWLQYTLSSGSVTRASGLVSARIPVFEVLRRRTRICVLIQPTADEKIVGMTTTRLPTLLLVFALVASACGGGDSGGTPDSGQATETASGDNDGGAAPTAGGFSKEDSRADAAGAGADFPIPIPGGWQLDQFAELAEEGVILSDGVALEYSTDDFDELVAFYDEWTAEQQDGYVRGEEADTVVYTKTSPLTQILISRNFEGFDGRSITFLSISATSE